MNGGSWTHPAEGTKETRKIMNVNFDEIRSEVDKLTKWDLSVTIDGKKYPVRRMTDGDVAQFSNIPSDNAGIQRVIDGLIEGDEKPEFSRTNVGDILTTVGEYLGAFLKKTDALRREVLKKRINDSMESGS
jgi:hypothetical protein